MSINVTVSGNPIRINHGKMVTLTDTKSKDEFDKRRLMRIEQVRQQSKDIAETLRNRVKKDKEKCLSEIEKEGEAKLKNWQNRKLLELQEQYHEALDEIGIGDSIDEEDSLIIQREINESKAKERGRVAAQRLQIEKNEENLKKALPKQRKIVSKDMSRNSRNTNSKRTKKKKKTDFDSDSENRVPLLDLYDDADLNFKSLCEKEQQTSQQIDTTPVEKSDKEAQTTQDLEEVRQSPKKFIGIDNRISERIKRRALLNSKVDDCNFLEKGEECTCQNCPKHKNQKLLNNNITRQINDQYEDDDNPIRTESRRRQRSVQDDLNPLITETRQRTRTSFQDDLNPVITESRQRTRTSFQDDLNPVITESRQRTRTSFQDDSNPVISETRQRTRASFHDDDLNPVITRQKGKTKIHDEIPSNTILTESKPKGRDESVSNLVTTDTRQKPRTSFQDDTLNSITTRPKVSTDETRQKKELIPSKPKVTLRSSKKGVIHIDEKNSKSVPYYDHLNRFSKTIQGKTLIEKISDDDVVVSPMISNDEELLEKMKRRDREAHLRGQMALEKNRIQREYRDLLRQLPALQKQERILDIGNDKEKYHMSRDRLEDLERRRQNRLDNAYEELFVRTKQPITIKKRTEDVEDIPTLNLSEWDTDRNEKLTSMLTNLKSQKESLLKEIENTLSKETLDDIKSKSTDYTRSIKKRKRDERPLSPTSSDLDSQTTKTKSSRSGPTPRKKAKNKLQTISTQTTPQVNTLQSASTSPIVPPESASTCPCTKDELCEIIIKLKDDDKPEIQVNPPYLGKSVRVVGEKLDKSKTSWKEQFGESSTSTSYYEPPNVTLTSLKTTSSGEGGGDPAPSSGGTERQQDTAPSSFDEKQLDPRLLTYIKKLLNMSRGSIDNLTVSSASDISTPSTSLLEAPSNNPLHQLKNLMKYFNINSNQLKKQLSDENLHATATSSGSGSSFDKTQYKSCTEIEKHHPVKQYNEIAKSCAEKINNLTAMIERVRAEKKKMIESTSSSSSTGSDLVTTSYKDLPEKSKKPEDDLLKIDYGYAQQLKGLSSEEIQKELQKPENVIVAETKQTAVVQDGATNKPIILRNETRTFENEKDGVSIGVREERIKASWMPDSPPIFLDIPKLPKLEAPSLDKKKKRPPSSKYLRTAHELSTIVEADSQLSTKGESPEKAKLSTTEVPDIIAEVKSSSDDVSEVDTMESMLLSIGMEWAIPTLKKTREALAMTSSSSTSNSGEVSLREFLSKISSNSTKSGSVLSESSQMGISLIQVDNRRTSTPIVGGDRSGDVRLGTESDVSSIRELSKTKESDEKFYDLLEGNTMTDSRN